jgi:MFS family permease
MMKFDGNLAWKQASAAVGANRELVLALAGVFFFLPSFALVMLFKQPVVPPDATSEQMMAVLQPYLASMAPWFLIGSIIQAFGQATLIELFGRPVRSTVGEALRRGLRALPYYIVVQLLVGMAVALAMVFAQMIGGIVAPVLGLVLAIYLACQVYGRVLVASTLVVLEDLNPIAAIVRSVRLSRGNGLRLGNFLFLLGVGCFFVITVLTILLGIAAALTMGEGRTADMLTGFFTSAAAAVVLCYVAAIAVAAYRQLAGALPEQATAPFE